MSENLTIYDVDFESPYGDFVNRLDSILAVKNMKSTVTEKATRNGKTMYCINISHDSDPNTTNVLFEKDTNTGNVICKPTGFSSFGGTFYKQEQLTDSCDPYDNTLVRFIDFLYEEAKLQKGTLVADNCYDKNAPHCIKNGVAMSAKKCIVDKNGTVYGAKDIKVQDGVKTDDYSVHFDTYLAPWIKEKRAEEPEFDSMLSDSSLSQNDKFMKVAKKLIELKTNDELESHEFRDLFSQVGMMTNNFNGNSTFLMIYKLLV